MFHLTDVLLLALTFTARVSMCVVIKSTLYLDSWWPKWPSMEGNFCGNNRQRLSSVWSSTIQSRRLGLTSSKPLHTGYQVCIVGWKHMLRICTLLDNISNTSLGSYALDQVYLNELHSCRKFAFANGADRKCCSDRISVLHLLQSNTW